MKTNAILIDPATKTLKEVFWKDRWSRSLQKLYDLLECEGIELIRNEARKDSLIVNSEAKTERELHLANERGVFIYQARSEARDSYCLPIIEIVGKALYQREYGRNGIAIPLKYDFEKASKLFYL
jgi:stringent starvation protein B